VQVVVESRRAAACSAQAAAFNAVINGWWGQHMYVYVHKTKLPCSRQVDSSPVTPWPTAGGALCTKHGLSAWM